MGVAIVRCDWYALGMVKHPPPTLLLAAALSLSGCSDGSSDTPLDTGSTEASTAPDDRLWPVDGWAVRTPAEQGMDAATLEGARDYAFAEGKNTQGVVVIRDGALVAEWYADGKDETSWAASWSVAKSFTSALIGIAIEEGLIPGVDVAMSDYLPSWQDTDKDPITLEDVLQMASGLTWDESYSPQDLTRSDIIAMVAGESDQLEYAKGRTVGVEPGDRFNYSSGDTMLLSGVLEAATGQSAP